MLWPQISPRLADSRIAREIRSTGSGWRSACGRSDQRSWSSKSGLVCNSAATPSACAKVPLQGQSAGCMTCHRLVPSMQGVCRGLQDICQAGRSSRELIVSLAAMASMSRNQTVSCRGHQGTRSTATLPGLAGAQQYRSASSHCSPRPSSTHVLPQPRCVTTFAGKAGRCACTCLQL